MRHFSKPNVYSVPTYSRNGESTSTTYRNVSLLGEDEETFTETMSRYPSAANLRDLFNQIVDNYHSFPAVGYLPSGESALEWLSYGEFHELVTSFANGLSKNSIWHGDIVGVLMESSVWFSISQWALATLGAIMMPINPSLPPDVINQIVRVFRCSAIFCSPKTYPLLTSALSSEIPATLSKLFLVCDNENLEKLKNENSESFLSRFSIPMLPLPSILSSEASDQLKPIAPTDVAVINFSSGRRGTFSPCALTHKSIIAAAAGIGSSGLSLGREIYYSTISMSIAFERTMQLAIMAHGGCIGFQHGGAIGAMKLIMPTIAAFSGNSMNGLANEIVESAMGSSWLMRAAFDFTFSIVAQSDESERPLPWLLREVIVEPFKKTVGGRLRCVVSSCSRLEPRAQFIIRTMLRVPVIQCYGTTETCGIISIQKAGDLSFGNSGAPISSCEVKLRDFEDSSYRISDDEPGEILIRGPLLFSGYHRNKSLTSQCMLPGGWFATGDLGRVLPNGTIQIVDTIEDWYSRRSGNGRR